MSARTAQRKTVAGKFADIRADYDMSKTSRMMRRRVGLAPQGGSADYHTRIEYRYYEDIEKARDMDRNDAVVGQAIDRAVVNIVRDGMSLRPNTGDESLNDDLQAAWNEFSRDPDQCDVAGELCFNDFERHAMRAVLLDGDCVITGTRTGAFQFFEGHTIGTNGREKNTVLGVEMDEFRRRKRYHVSRDAPDANATNPKQHSTPLSVRDQNGLRQLFHVYNSKRTTMTRGVTAFAPVFQLAGMFEDANFAKLVQQQVLACFAVFRERGPGTPAGTLPSAAYGDSTSETTTTGTRQIEGVAPGMEILGAPGEKLHGFSPDIPGQGFFDHVRLMLQLIGVNLGVPLVVLLMDASETNFSGYRGALSEARQGFESNQRNLIKRLNRPAYKWWITQLMTTDRAVLKASKAAGVDVFGHHWHPPKWSYIEPVKDAQGDLLRVRNGLTSPSRLQNERGNDWDEIIEETVSDNGRAIRRAKVEAELINDEFDDGTPVHWRELISLPTPDGVMVGLDREEASANAE